MIVIEKGVGNFSTYSPNMPGCLATGRTIEKTVNEMHAAIEFHLEGMVENGEEFPVARSLNSYLLETVENPADVITSIEVETPALALAWCSVGKTISFIYQLSSHHQLSSISE